jgi:hypothetical protein
MTRRQKSVMVSDDDMAKLDDPVNLFSGDRNILAELGQPRDQVEGVRLVNLIQKPELGGVLLIFEHPEYEEVQDLAEAPRHKVKDPELARPSRRPKKP